MSNIQHAALTEPRRGTGTVTRAGRDAVYVLGMLVQSIAGFWVLAACVMATAIMLPTVVGVFVGVGSAYVLRGVTELDRRLAGWYLRRPIRGRYRRPPAPGAIALVKTVGRDPRTWKDAGWLLGNSVGGFAAGTVAVVVSALTLSYVTTPLWWWAVPHPHDKLRRAQPRDLHGHLDFAGARHDPDRSRAGAALARAQPAHRTGARPGRAQRTGG